MGQKTEVRVREWEGDAFTVLGSRGTPSGPATLRCTADTQFSLLLRSARVPPGRPRSLSTISAKLLQH